MTREKNAIQAPKRPKQQTKNNQRGAGKGCLQPRAFFRTPNNFYLQKHSVGVVCRAQRQQDLLQLLVHRFEHPYSTLCLLGSPSSSKIMLFTMEKISSLFYCETQYFVKLTGLEHRVIFVFFRSQPAFCVSILHSIQQRASARNVEHWSSKVYTQRPSSSLSLPNQTLRADFCFSVLSLWSITGTNLTRTKRQEVEAMVKNQ